MGVYIGIDLHSNNCFVTVIEESGKVVYEKRLSNDLPLIVSELEPYRDHCEGVVVESTYNWYWLVDGLMEAGYGLHLANTAAIQQYYGIRRSKASRRWCWPG